MWSACRNPELEMRQFSMCSAKAASSSRSMGFPFRLLLWYHGTTITRGGAMGAANDAPEVERVQTGVRLEKRMLKVLKGLAELKDMSLGDLIEGIVLHAMEGKAPFSKDTLEQIAHLR